MSIDDKILKEIARYNSINKYIMEQDVPPPPGDPAAAIPPPPGDLAAPADPAAAGADPAAPAPPAAPGAEGEAAQHWHAGAGRGAMRGDNVTKKP